MALRHCYIVTAALPRPCFHSCSAARTFCHSTAGPLLQCYHHNTAELPLQHCHSCSIATPVRLLWQGCKFARYCCMLAAAQVRIATTLLGYEHSNSTASDTVSTLSLLPCSCSMISNGICFFLSMSRSSPPPLPLAPLSAFSADMVFQAHDAQTAEEIL